MRLGWFRMMGRRDNQPWLRCEIVNGQYEFVREQDLDLIGQWCRENDCGRRMSFDEFKKTNQWKIADPTR